MEITPSSISEKNSEFRPNRLSRETSPYLLQHQHNPVDWYAWGEEAFAAARDQDKPIFLSIGYSTCFWCHVMERQSFENPAIAAEMNQRFINIKVDREERPDVDQLYMIAVQVLTRQGGWPMSVFLRPDLRPFYGGTYFPPTDSHGRPGFVTLLRSLEEAYRNRKSDVDRTADQIVDILEDLSQPHAPVGPMRIDQPYIDALIRRSVVDYDPAHGGFGTAPKFPRETLLELLLMFITRPGSGQSNHSQIDNLKAQILHCLDAMAAGGIHDHLGGGFHRYSTDAEWLIPHFEIMLYDNAMLAWCYAEAYRQTSEPRYAQVAREVCDFILREMTSPEGAFYTAMDAEVDGQEGLNYLWTTDEIRDILGADDAAVFAKAYGVDLGPNFADPHHGSGAADKNVLFLADAALAESRADELRSMRQKLKSARDQRKQPILDTKIITSWNVLMIRALAHASFALKESRYLDAAKTAAEFLLKNHRTDDDGLFRTSRDGAAKHRAFLDDYAFLAQALLALAEASAEPKWRASAQEISDKMLDLFSDSADGLFFTDRHATDLFVRQKTASDSPLPSGNAIAAMVLLELGKHENARKLIAAFAPQLERGAEGMSAMLQAAFAYIHEQGPIEIAAAASNSSRSIASPEQIAAGVVAMRAIWISPTELDVQVNILDGFHINAHEASNGLIATTLTLSSIGAAIDYPPAIERKFDFADESIRVYEDAFHIRVRLAQPIAQQELELRLTYQACDESSCLPAVTKTLRVINEK